LRKKIITYYQYLSLVEGWCEGQGSDDGDVLRPSLDETAYLVVDNSVADDDDGARHVMSDERHRDDEHRILVGQKHTLVVQRSLHPVADDRIQDHYRSRQPEQAVAVI